MSALGETFRVAIYDEFLDALVRIPRAQQKKVNKFLRRFRQSPTDPSINYESISTFKDPNLRTVRIDDAYRAIVLKPSQGNVYVLLWVDHHDEAMAWARNRRLSIHPETGALQVIEARVVEELAPADPAAASVAGAPAPALFDGVRDRELVRLGVPEEQLAAVRVVRDGAGLDALRGRIPDEAYEALCFLADGESLADVEEAMAPRPAPESVDTSDFGAALERDDSKRRFAIVDDDTSLAAMLDAPLDKWRVFLHPSQRRLVDRSFPGPVRVLGGAGTGKTVVAMHRAAYLVRERFTEPGDRLLFTTFTKNLAADIRANLRALCSAEELARIEVVHLDKWVSDQLGRAGYAFKVAYYPSDAVAKEAWEAALTLRPEDLGASAAFYRDEWELVVQEQGCESWEQYRKASRAGRGVPLNRAQRKAIWRVFADYRERLDRAQRREPADAMRDLVVLLQTGTLRMAYRAIVVDEAQDMSTEAFRLLRAVIPEERADDLFIVGDGHQRIYNRRVVLGRARINVRGRRGRRLRINYRTTEEIRRFAVALLEGLAVDDLDEGRDTTRGYTSLTRGTPPEVMVFAGFDDEVAGIVGWIAQGDPQRTCLVARTAAQRDRYERALRAAGLETYPVRRSVAEDLAAPGVRVATMHRVKGLEFDRVVVAGADRGAIPSREALELTEDEARREDAETIERSLLYVAITRARKAVLITAFGEKSGWL